MWGAFCWQGLGPLVFLEERVTANQYKVLVEWLVEVIRGRWFNGFENVETCAMMCYDLHNNQILTQFKANGKLELDKWVNIFWKNDIQWSGRVSETCQINTKALWCCSGDMWWPNSLLRQSFSLICVRLWFSAVANLSPFTINDSLLSEKLQVQTKLVQQQIFGTIINYTVE